MFFVNMLIGSKVGRIGLYVVLGVTAFAIYTKMVASNAATQEKLKGDLRGLHNAAARISRMRNVEPASRERLLANLSGGTF